MWDLPGPELEPMSPALAGEFLTTAPPGKSKIDFFHTKNYARGYQRIYIHSCGTSVNDGSLGLFFSGECGLEERTCPLELDPPPPT